MKHPARTTSAALIVLAGVSTHTMAQADYAEDFESIANAQFGFEPQTLIDQGWIFRNQSEPAVGAAWVPGDNFGGVPFDGQGYLATSGLVTDFFGGKASTWAILPPIAGQQPGDIFTLWVYGGGSAVHPTYLDIRYAPSGDSTGSDAEDVGDFTEVLYTAELPIATLGYQRITATIPGTGRIAIRFHAPYLRTFAGNGANISLDTLSIGNAADPCGIDLPDPGETVVWTAASGPYTVCQDLLIPAGATLIIEPGTTVDCSGGKLRIEGELEAGADDAAPTVFTGSPPSGSSIEIASGGRAVITNAAIGARFNSIGTDSTMVITNSSIGPGGQIDGLGGFVGVDNCMFDTGSMGGFNPVAGTIKLTNSTFVNGAYAYIGGLLHLDNITIDGNALGIVGESTAHPVLLDNISVTNNTAGAGIRMYGPNFLIGNNVTLAGNLYPLEMYLNGAGLLPGSVLPASGNTNNYVPVESLGFAQQRRWADTGIPYVIGSFADIRGGSLTVEPGANLKFRANAGSFIVGSADMVLEGTRENPILIESFTPAQPWFGLKWVDVFDAKMRHTIIDSGQIAVQSDGGVMDMIHSTVRNAQEGTASVTGGIVRLFGTRIVDNDTGMITTGSGRIEADGFAAPSIFEGNTVAIDYRNNNTVPFVRNNWWGDATGPYSILHPTGQGDTVLGVHPAGFSPFLTAPPKLDDDFPTVDLEPVTFTMQKGDKAILRWNSGDDRAIVAHRVEFADHDFPNEFRLIAELGPDAQSYEFVAPSVLPNNLYPTPSAIRVVAIDDAGQEAWDKHVLRIPYQEDWTVIDETIAPIGPVVRPHENIDVCWSPGGATSAYVLLDGIGLSDSAGGTNTGCLPIGATLPYSSTDTARILVISSFGAGGRIHYSFGDYFSIRPHDELGDEPPSVSVTSPAAGQRFPGLTTIPVRWDAGDNEGIRSFNIQASFDAGRTWNSVARDLPGDARSFDWPLPESTGIADVRVRVVAFDHRFQDSSDTTGPIAITETDPCPADLDSNGTLNFFDISLYIAAFNNADPGADLDNNGTLNFFDINLYLTAFNTGCP